MKKHKKQIPIAVVMTDSHKHKDNIAQVEDIEGQAIALCKKLDVVHLFHGGDMVTARQAQPLEVLQSVQRFRDRLRQENICINIIEGNHDKTDLERESGYTSILHDDIWFRVHGKSFSYKYFGDYGNSKVVIHMLPYFPEQGTYVERLNKLAESLEDGKYHILITHIGINGGLAHESASTNKEVPAECFKAFDKVLVGHYHNQCEIDGHIFYMGSTHQQNFGEDNQKGFTVIYHDGSHEFVKSDFTEYRTLMVDVDEVDNKFLKKLKKDITSSGDKVRVVVTGDESRLKTIDKKAFTEAGVSKLKLNEESVGLADARREADAFKSFTKQEILREYKSFSVSIEVDSSLGLEYLEDIKE